MNYDFQITMSDDSDEGQAVATFAAREHMSLDEAARELFLHGARTIQVVSPAYREEEPIELLARLKEEKARRLNGLVGPVKDRDIIGLLSDDSEGVALIRQSVTDRRQVNAAWF